MVRNPDLRSVVLALTAMTIGVILLSGCVPATPVAQTAVGSSPSREELLQYYAPIIYQGAATDQDYLSAVDFDGDWIGNNNWENQPAGDLTGVVYGSVIETETHYYLFYSLFHPRDYTDEPCAESSGCHENDMESLEVVVAKDGTPYGHPIALLTLAHSHIYLYAFDPIVGRGALNLHGTASAEDGHPIVWVETFGHGIYGRRQILAPAKIIYRPASQGTRPNGIKDEAAAYRLVSIYDTLWQHRSEIGDGQLFDRPFDYRGHTLPGSFDGENWGEDKANPPWAYDQEIGKALSRGDFFLDPAKAFGYFASYKGELSRTYLFNPFLADLD